MKRKLTLVIIFLLILISLFYGEYYFYNKKIAKDQIMVASKTIKQGTLIQAEDFVVKETINFDDDIYIHSSEALVGKYATKPIETNRVIKTDDVSSTVVPSVDTLIHEDNALISLKLKNVEAVCWNFKVNDDVSLYFASKNKKYHSKLFTDLRVVKILDKDLMEVKNQMNQAAYVIFEVAQKDAQEILDLKTEGQLSIFIH
jgi:Flp pilus assembly protein CpaB